MKETARAAKAAKYFGGNYNCSQSVVLAFEDKLGIPFDVLENVSIGFGAGMARNGEVCGAASGGIMVLSKLLGEQGTPNQEKRDLVYPTVDRYLNSFKSENESWRCREILGGVDLSTSAGQKFFKENSLKEAVCMKCVTSSVDLIEGLLPRVH